MNTSLPPLLLEATSTFYPETDIHSVEKRETEVGRAAI